MIINSLAVKRKPGGQGRLGHFREKKFKKVHFRVDIGQVECYNELTLTVISHYGAKAVKKYVQREVEGLIVGSYNVSVDAQGRLIIPNNWHTDLGELVVVVRDLSASGEHFLTALTIPAFNSTLNDFSHTLATDNRYSDATRSILQYARDCKLDQKRRISIDQENLKYAGITQNAVLCANIRSSNPVFEIWSPEALDRNNKSFDEWQARDAFQRNAEEVKGHQ
jgi:DNA-binding transcriptional regulator/RsmH inhibitor MraZ